MRTTRGVARQLRIINEMMKRNGPDRHTMALAEHLHIVRNTLTWVLGKDTFVSPAQWAQEIKEQDIKYNRKAREEQEYGQTKDVH